MVSFGKSFFQVFALGLLLAALCALPSCQDEELVAGKAFNNDREIDKINKLTAIAKEAEALWPGYTVPQTHPLLLIFQDEDGEGTIGYLLNITEVPEGSEKMDSAPVRGITVYRNDLLAQEARTHFGGSLPPFAFDLELKGIIFFMVSEIIPPPSPYFAFKAVGGNDLALLVTHELFHQFQFDKPWTLNGFRQDFLGYPQTADMIALSLLLSDQLSGAYQGGSPESFLEKYVAIRQRQMAIDPSTQKLVRHQALFTESIEGSARYVEHFSALATSYPTISNDPTHGYQAQLDTVKYSATLARHILVQRIPYHVGAAIIHLLDGLNVDVVGNLPRGETPYSLARTYLKKDDAYFDGVLAALLASVNWSSYQARAQELEALLKR